MQLASRACVWRVMLALFAWYGALSGAAGVDVLTTDVGAVSDEATPSHPQVCVVQIMASGAVLSTFVDHPTDHSLAVLVPTEIATNVPVSCQDLTSLGLGVANQEPAPVNVQITVFTHQGTSLCTRGPFTLSENGARGVVFGSDCVEAQPGMIVVDGNPMDWDAAGIPRLIIDPAGDGPHSPGDYDDSAPPGLDLLSLRVTDDRINIYFLLEFAGPPVYASFLLLDVDTNPTTGCQAHGVGFEYGLTFLSYAIQNSSIGDARDCVWRGTDFPGALQAAVGGNFIEASVPINTLQILNPMLTQFDIGCGNDQCPNARYELQKAAVVPFADFTITEP